MKEDIEIMMDFKRRELTQNEKEMVNQAFLKLQKLCK